MSKSLTVEDFVLANLILTDNYSSEFKIKRQHDIQLIIRQVEQVAKLGIHRQIAQCVYMLAKLKPFSSSNLRTSVLVSLIMASRSGINLSVDQLYGLLKHESSIEVIEKSLKQ